MKIIYAKKSSGIDEQGSFQNPEYYDKPNTAAESVVIYGDYPKIKADYEELSVGVEVRKLPKTKPLTVNVSVGITPELQATIDQAKAECEKVVAENELLKKQVKAYEVVGAQNSELMSENSRLSDALTRLEGISNEREALVAEIEALKAQVIELQKPAETKDESVDLFAEAEKPKDPKAKK